MTGQPNFRVTRHTLTPTGPAAERWRDIASMFEINVEDTGRGWAVRRGGCCLDRDGEWEYEPIPSSRDDQFFARCRFPLVVAKAAALLALTGHAVNGRTWDEWCEYALANPRDTP